MNLAKYEEIILGTLIFAYLVSPPHRACSQKFDVGAELLDHLNRYNFNHSNTDKGYRVLKARFSEKNQRKTVC